MYGCFWMLTKGGVSPPGNTVVLAAYSTGGKEDAKRAAVHKKHKAKVWKELDFLGKIA